MLCLVLANVQCLLSFISLNAFSFFYFPHLQIQCLVEDVSCFLRPTQRNEIAHYLNILVIKLSVSNYNYMKNKTRNKKYIFCGDVDSVSMQRKPKKNAVSPTYLLTLSHSEYLLRPCCPLETASQRFVPKTLQ